MAAPGKGQPGGLLAAIRCDFRLRRAAVGGLEASRQLHREWRISATTPQ